MNEGFFWHLAVILGLASAGMVTNQTEVANANPLVHPKAIKVCVSRGPLCLEHTTFRASRRHVVWLGLSKRGGGDGGGWLGGDGRRGGGEGGVQNWYLFLGFSRGSGRYSQRTGPLFGEGGRGGGEEMKMLTNRSGKSNYTPEGQQVCVPAWPMCLEQFSARNRAAHGVWLGLRKRGGGEAGREGKGGRGSLAARVRILSGPDIFLGRGGGEERGGGGRMHEIEMEMVANNAGTRRCTIYMCLERGFLPRAKVLRSEN